MTPVAVAVVIPALDEERGIARVLADLPRATPGARVVEVVVVDNGSRDATARVAAERGARVVHEPRRGYGRACQAGLAAVAALSPPPEVVVFLDADASDRPEELPMVLAPLLEGAADLVIGSRMILPASRRALLPQARFGNWLAGRLLGLRFGARVTDLGPFRAIRRAALARLAMDDEAFGWTVQMQARALRLGLAVVEVPVSYRARIGRSKISGTLRGSFWAGVTILRVILAESCRSRRAAEA